MKLVIAEKPSVAQSLAHVIGATKPQDGYLEGNCYLARWCVGHLVEFYAQSATMSALPKAINNNETSYPRRHSFSCAVGLFCVAGKNKPPCSAGGGQIFRYKQTPVKR